MAQSVKYLLCKHKVLESHWQNSLDNCTLIKPELRRQRQVSP